MSDPTAILETDDWAMRTARITLKRKREAENTGSGFTLGQFATVLRERLRVDPVQQAKIKVAKVEAAAPAGVLEAANAIYDAYPRKVGKRVAVPAIQRALWRCQKTGFAEGCEVYLLRKTQAFAAAVAKWSEQDRQFVPHPSTWFNQDRYLDSPSTWERINPNQPQQSPVRVELA